MIFWMGKTARHLKANLHHRLDDAVAAGKGAVVVMALLAVGREGLETALFLWAGAKATGASTNPLVGAVLGLAVAVALGWAVYRGAVRLNLRLFFAWTGVLLIVIAAGVLAYGVHDLQEARLLPGLHSVAFDVSAQVPPSSWYATLLKGVFNFSPVTTWLEATAWVLFVVPVMTLFVRSVWFTPTPVRAPAPAAVVAAH